MPKGIFFMKHYPVSVSFSCCRLEPAVTSAPRPAFGGSKGLNIYCDQAEDNIARSSKSEMFIYHDEPENKENG